MLLVLLLQKLEMSLIVGTRLGAQAGPGRAGRFTQAGHRDEGLRGTGRMTLPSPRPEPPCDSPEPFPGRVARSGWSFGWWLLFLLHCGLRWSVGDLLPFL